MSLEVVKTIRQKYPTPLGPQHGDFLEELATALGLGLVQKNWGTYVLTRDGIGISQDCLMAHGGYHWDVLRDGENRAEPTFELVVHEGTEDPIILPESRYVAPRSRPASPGAPQEPPPSPPPTPPSFDAQGAVQALAGALQEFVRLVETRFGATEDAVNSLAAFTNDLDRRLQAPQTVKAVGATNSVWSNPLRTHSHPFELTINLEGK